MLPVLLQLGGLHLYTYGFAVALAFILGISLAMRETRRRGEDPQRILDLAFYLILASLAGSRLLYVILNLEDYLNHPLDILKVWKGGLVFYGGFFAAIVVTLWYLRKHGMDVWRTADTIAPSIPLGHAIGKLGCLAAGCCHGRPSDLPWAVTFRDPRGLAPLNVPLHPTQAYESLSSFAIFLILMGLRKRVRFGGQLFWTYVLAYAPLRFALEFLRGDLGRGFPLQSPISSTQWISLLLVPTSIWMLWTLSKKGDTR